MSLRAILGLLLICDRGYLTNGDLPTFQTDLKLRLRSLCSHCTYACRFLEVWETSNLTSLYLDKIRGCGQHYNHRGPEFMLIGTQKGGSTDMYERLNLHNASFALSSNIKDKELHFFDWQCLGPMLGRDKQQDNIHRRKLDRPDSQTWCDAIHYSENVDRIRHLSEVSDITGEATVNYFFYPEIPAMAKTCFPETKFIVMLREPIDRALSGYHQHIHKQHLPFSESIQLEQKILRKCKLFGSYKISSTFNLFKDCVYPLFVVEVLEATMTEGGPWEHFKEFKQTPRTCNNAFIRWHSHILRGLYYYHLHAWYEHFPSNQILVLKSENYFVDPENEVKKIIKFLNASGTEISPTAVTSETLFTNSKTKGKVPANTRKVLNELFQPYTDAMGELLKSQNIPWNDWD